MREDYLDHPLLFLAWMVAFEKLAKWLTKPRGPQPKDEMGLVEMERDGVSTREARSPYTFFTIHAPGTMGHGGSTDKCV